MTQTHQSWYAAARTHDAGARTNTHAHTRTRGIKPDPQPRYAAAAPPLSHANDTGHTQRHENGHIRRNEAEARPRQHEGGRSPAARKRTGPDPAGVMRRVLVARARSRRGAGEARAGETERASRGHHGQPGHAVRAQTDKTRPSRAFLAIARVPAPGAHCRPSLAARRHGRARERHTSARASPHISARASPHARARAHARTRARTNARTNPTHARKHARARVYTRNGARRRQIPPL